MKVVSRPDGRLGLEFSYNPLTVAKIKSVVGMVWEPSSRQWVGYPEAVADAIAKSGVGYPMAEPPATESLTGETLRGLRAYQQEGVNFLLNAKYAILADDMGLGKTATALTAAYYTAKSPRVLVVTPSYVRGVWYSDSIAAGGGEIRKWWPDINAAVFRPIGTRPSLCPNVSIVLVHYDILHAWADSIAAWDPTVCIFDECHYLMSEGSRRSKAARAVSANARYRWGLSGTPLTNRPRDLWNVVDTLRPGTFGNFFSFGRAFCDAHKEAVTPTKTVWKFDGKSNLELLNARMRYFMLRRLKTDVELQLPPKTRQLVTVETKSSKVVAMLSARDLRKALDVAANAKLPAASELIGEHLAAGRKVVAFCWRRTVAESLANDARIGGYEASLIHGGVETTARDTALADARGAPGGHLLAVTIDAAATGVDFSHADTAVFAELTWEPHKLLQAESRLHRFGAKNPVLIQYVIASGTSDEMVADAVIQKLDTFEAAIGTTGESLASDLRRPEEEVMAELYASLGFKAA